MIILTTKWQRIERDFVALEGLNNADMGFQIGEVSTVPVWIDGVISEDRGWAPWWD